MHIITPCVAKASNNRRQGSMDRHTVNVGPSSSQKRAWIETRQRENTDEHELADELEEKTIQMACKVYNVHRDLVTIPMIREMRSILLSETRCELPGIPPDAENDLKRRAADMAQQAHANAHAQFIKAKRDPFNRSYDGVLVQLFALQSRHSISPLHDRAIAYLQREYIGYDDLSFQRRGHDAMVMARLTSKPQQVGTGEPVTLRVSDADTALPIDCAEYEEQVVRLREQVNNLRLFNDVLVVENRTLEKSKLDLEERLKKAIDQESQENNLKAQEEPQAANATALFAAETNAAIEQEKAKFEQRIQEIELARQQEIDNLKAEMNELRERCQEQEQLADSAKKEVNNKDKKIETLECEYQALKDNRLEQLKIASQ